MARDGTMTKKIDGKSYDLFICICNKITRKQVLDDYKQYMVVEGAAFSHKIIQKHRGSKTSLKN